MAEKTTVKSRIEALGVLLDEAYKDISKRKGNYQIIGDVMNARMRLPSGIVVPLKMHRYVYENYDIFILRAYVQLYQNRVKAEADEAIQRAGRLAELGAKKKRVYEMREDGSYTKDEFIERKEMIENQIAAEKISFSETKIEQYDVEALLAYSDKFAINLGRQWFDLRPELRPRFQKLVFPEGISYERDNGFGTARMGSIFEANQLFHAKSPR